MTTLAFSRFLEICDALIYPATDVFELKYPALYFFDLIADWIVDLALHVGAIAFAAILGEDGALCGG